VVCVITLPCSPAAENVERTTLGIEPDVGIVCEHLGRDVTSDCYHGLIAGLRIG